MATSAILLCSTGLSQAADPAALPDKWLPSVEMEGRFNDDRSIAYPKLLIPLQQDENSLLFTDIRSRFDNQDSQEYNIGLGYRQITGDWIIGGYGFADYLNSSNDNAYWQATIGFEAMTENWDFRINGYLPEATEHSLGGGGGIASSSFGIDAGGNFGITTTTGGGGTERALPGFDAEIGYKLPVDIVDFRVFGGAYHFEADGYDNVSGPKARAELTLGHEHLGFIPEGVEFTAGVQYQNDGPREDTTTALAQIRIPFGGGKKSNRPPLSALESRMTNFIERDVDIVAQEGTSSASTTTTEAATVTINGQDYSRIAATVDSGTSDINAELVAAGASSLIVFDGAINLGIYGLSPLAGQTLIGAGSTLQAVSASGKTATTTIAGTRPTVDTSGAFSINDNSVTIQGMDMVGLAGGSMDINGTDALLNDVQVDGGGITLRGSNIQILNSSVTNAGSTSAISINGVFGGGNTLIENTTLSGGDYGLILAQTSGVIVRNLTIDNMSNTAMVVEDSTGLSGDITVTNTPTLCDVRGSNSGSFTINGTTSCP